MNVARGLEYTERCRRKYQFVHHSLAAKNENQRAFKELVASYIISALPDCVLRWKALSFDVFSIHVIC